MNIVFRAVAVWVALAAGAAKAETLRCQSLNGNLNCTGSGGASCQTVNGRTVCQGANGAVLQSFGTRQVPATVGEAPHPAQKPAPVSQDHRDDDGEDERD